MDSIKRVKIINQYNRYFGKTGIIISEREINHVCVDTYKAHIVKLDGYLTTQPEFYDNELEFLN